MWPEVGDVWRSPQNDVWLVTGFREPVWYAVLLDGTIDERMVEVKFHYRALGRIRGAGWTLVSGRT